MKKFCFYLSAGLMMMVSALCTSCSKEDVVTAAIVTVRQAADNTYYLQVDENTSLLPTNSDWGSTKFENVPFRAYVQLRGQKKADSKVGYTQQAEVISFVTILTKDLEPTTGSELADDAFYGNDPVGIYYNWATNVEDGFLTVNFAGMWGDRSSIHTLHMVTTNDTDESIDVVFHHDADGDVPVPHYLVNGLVAFRLNSLHDTKGKTLPFNMHYSYMDPVTGLTADKRKATIAAYRTGISSYFDSVKSEKVLYIDQVNIQ